MQLPQVLTSPRAWSIHVEWQWPENSGEHSRLEMQYLNADGRLQRQVIAWPLAGVLIGGLKAGERLQIRLRPIDKNGAVREWTQGDWIEGVSSSNADEYLAALSITAGSDMRLMKTFSTPQFKIVNGEVFIRDAFISGTIHAAETPKTSNSHIDVGKILDDAWKSGRRSVAEGLEALAMAASAYPQDYKQHARGGETTPSTYTVSMGIAVNDASSVSGIARNIDNFSVEMSDKGVVVNMASGGRIVLGNWGDSSITVSKPLPPLTPDEEKYGRGLCQLPTGWEDLNGSESWLAHLSKDLRAQWPALSREQKMAIAHTIGELTEELINTANERAW
ncbi:hypothetical protein NNO02_10520 [Citrobacter sp. Awk 2]|uniref:hypothetical protein n=1 Tax=Citrobacter sp. Awk 2 TaxID=2963959 RepID=UPI002303F3BE|nr:hypothetical protein [Citrobacter sp. Awk 2]MDA8502885.1 hypothetical protein [Citrobacter sp. Awk 2]